MIILEAKRVSRMRFQKGCSRTVFWLPKKVFQNGHSKSKKKIKFGNEILEWVFCKLLLGLWKTHSKRNKCTLEQAFRNDLLAYGKGGLERPFQKQQVHFGTNFLERVCFRKTFFQNGHFGSNKKSFWKTCSGNMSTT